MYFLWLRFYLIKRYIFSKDFWDYYLSNSIHGKYDKMKNKVFLMHLKTVMSLEIRPLAALSPPPTQKMCFIGLRSRASLLISASVFAGGGMLMPTAFALISIVSV